MFIIHLLTYKFSVTQLHLTEQGRWLPVSCSSAAEHLADRGVHWVQPHQWTTGGLPSWGDQLGLSVGAGGGMAVPRERGPHVTPQLCLLLWSNPQLWGQVPPQSSHGWLLIHLCSRAGTDGILRHQEDSEGNPQDPWPGEQDPPRKNLAHPSSGPHVPSGWHGLRWRFRPWTD